VKAPLQLEEKLLRAALALGVALRLAHFLRNPSIWHDEAALVLSAQNLPFAEHLGPLVHSAPAPPLYVALVRAVSLFLGNGLPALRLPSLLASLAALLLFALVARRFLPPASAALAILLFAVSDRLLWHAVEAKPYSGDVLVAVLGLRLLVAFEERGGPGSFLLGAALFPVLAWLSYPAGFVLGGLLLALLPAVLRSKRALLPAWLLAAALPFASFLALVLGPVRAQRDARLESFWSDALPDRSRPLSVPAWAIARSAQVLDQPLKPANGLLVPLTLLGVAAFARKGERARLVAMAGPGVLAFGAALAGAYPWSRSRVTIFLAPAVCLLTARGAEATFARLETLRGRGGARRAGAGVLAALLVVALSLPALRAAVKVVVPWPRADQNGAVEWIAARRVEGEPVRGNHWEHEVLFRSLGPLYDDISRPPRPDGRLFVVVTSAREEERAAALAAVVARGFRVAERADLSRNTVALLVPREAE
jgi:hypothetical protein